MLIKIDKDRYVNSDHITLIEPAPENNNLARIHLSDGQRVSTPLSIITYLVQALDANDAFTEVQPQPLSLTSQVAQFLRNQSAGQTIENLAMEFNETEEMIQAAVNELLANNTAKELIAPDADNYIPVYFHASNPLFTGTSDPLW